MAKGKSKSKEVVAVTEEEDLRRKFEFMIEDEVKDFFLEMPTSEQIRQAEWHYSKVYNKALVEGVTTTPEMMDILTQRGLYGPHYEKKLQELQVSIAIMDTFVRMREMLATHKDVARKIEEHDQHIAILYDYIQKLLEPPDSSKKKPIGYIYPEENE